MDPLSIQALREAVALARENKQGISVKTGIGNVLIMPQPTSDPDADFAVVVNSAHLTELLDERDALQNVLLHEHGQKSWDTGCVWVCEEHPWLLMEQCECGCGMPPISITDLQKELGKLRAALERLLIFVRFAPLYKPQTLVSTSDALLAEMGSQGVALGLEPKPGEAGE